MFVFLFVNPHPFGVANHHLNEFRIEALCVWFTDPRIQEVLGCPKSRGIEMSSNANQPTTATDTPRELLWMSSKSHFPRSHELCRTPGFRCFQGVCNLKQIVRRPFTTSGRSVESIRSVWYGGMPSICRRRMKSSLTVAISGTFLNPSHNGVSLTPRIDDDSVNKTPSYPRRP
jgi:hypothetical protein